ncbi:MAG: EVE domain-containing protein [Candidatus Zixiibacteriota bacterium]
MKKYWLMKTEPATFSIDDLERDKTCHWEGIRNYQARNIMRDEFQVGDEVLIYHSSTKIPGAAGIAKVVKEAYPDFTAWDTKSKYFDKRSTPENPVWLMVDLEFVSRFLHFVSITEIKNNPKLDGIMVAKRGMRLSIQPLSKEHFEIIKRAGMET